MDGFSDNDLDEMRERFNLIDAEFREGWNHNQINDWVDDIELPDWETFD